MTTSSRCYASAVALFGLILAPWPAAVAASVPLLDDTGHPPDKRTLAIGDAAPDFALPGVDGRTYRLADFAGPDVLMVLFTSNHCPTAALDRHAPGPIPHTVLIAPGGEILWRHNGVIDRATAISKIVETMTPHYQPEVPKPVPGNKAE